MSDRSHPFEPHMRRALELAVRHVPHPNPRVGAVVVDTEGQVVGEGSHRGVGSPHAEVLALEQAGVKARGGTLVVTLEPCVHHGETPPCVEAVLASGIRRVVVGAEDPDPRVRGGGLEALTGAGLTVERWEDAEEVEDADAGYFHHRRTGLPLLVLKMAATLDGQAVTRDGASQWITGAQAREDSHRLRAGVDAVMVGAGTLRADDPLLTVRLDGYGGPQPRPVVVAGATPLPGSARIWSRDPLVFSSKPRRVPAGEVVVVRGLDELADPQAVAEVLGERGMLTVLVEGGPTLASSLWRAGLIERGTFYLAGKIAAGTGRGPFAGELAELEQLAEVTITGVVRVGPDLRVDWRR